MASLFGIGGRKSAVYRKLHQSDSDISDTDEEERVVFRKPGDLELYLVPHHDQTRVRRTSCVTPKCKLICVVTLLSVAFLVSAAIVIARYVMRHQLVHSAQFESGNWNITLKDYTVENGLVLLDVDGDGGEDLIFSTAVNKLMMKMMTMGHSYPEYSHQQKICEEMGLEYPCTGMLFALRGYNGKELWRLPVRGVLFNLNCNQFDLDGDGRMDCIGTGRLGGIVAFNPYKGERLWMADSDSHLNAGWNAYQARPLPDWDGDGIPEILIANGGDPSKRPKELNRTSGRLLILSGKSGKLLGDRYLNMPNDKETYMTPVLYRQTDGSPTYILFGSGGETVPGDFMGISVGDFCRYILVDSPKCPPRENITWSNLKKDPDGIFVLFRGEKKGVMVPPVIVDVNKDGIMDIVVSAYEGAVMLLDGKTMTHTWRVNFTNMESYSTPAPGYFDDDDVLDFMLHWNKGYWDGGYNSSFVAVISGKTGEVMWKTNSVKDIVASNLVMSTKENHHDYFIFRRTKLTFDNPSQAPRKRRHGSDHPIPQTNGGDSLPPPPFQMYGDEYYSKCSQINSPRTEELFLIDRSTVHKPLRILELGPREYYYDPTEIASSMQTQAMHGGGMGGAAMEAAMGQAGQQGEPGTNQNDHHVQIHTHSDEQHGNATDDAGGIPTDAGHNQDGSRLNGDQEESVDNTDVVDQNGDDNLDADQEHDDAESLGRPRKKAKKRDITGGPKSQFCSYMMPDSGSTGAIGDVDGDGLIDYISILPYQAKLHDTKYNDVGFYSETVIHKVSVEKLLKNRQLTAVGVDAETKMKSESAGVHRSIPIFLPASEQKWTKYMGAKGNNWFT